MVFSLLCITGYGTSWSYASFTAFYLGLMESNVDVEIAFEVAKCHLATPL